MTFEDLPPDWADRPTDPAIWEDVLDLLVSPEDRRARSLAVIACRADGRLLQPCLIGPGVDAFDPVVAANAVGALVEALSPEEPEGQLVIAVARPDGLSLTDDDHRWRASFADALERTPWSLHSAHVVTTTGSRLIPAA